VLVMRKYWVTGLYLMVQNGTDEYRTFRDARCQLVSRYATSDENERKQVPFGMNAETIVGCSMVNDGGYVCRLEGCSRKLCEDCLLNLPNPILLVRELPRKQSFDLTALHQLLEPDKQKRVCYTQRF
jgi:hypothetical protein